MGKPPVLKHLAHKTYMTNVIAAVVFAGVGAFAFRVLYTWRRQRLFKDFYANYDADKAFERMSSHEGLFQCCDS